MLRTSWAMKNSPFFAPSGQAFRGVCSFEIPLEAIAGLDYWNPLLVDASRVVIEVRHLTRRWFTDLTACQKHFEWQFTEGMYQPQAAGDHVSMQKVELETENCKLHTSPSKASREQLHIEVHC